MPKTLVCLHGWGGSQESFTELRHALRETDITVLTPDLPGFGTEPEPDRPWTNDDYADWVASWIKKQGMQGEWYLLGHSHGGRIAIKLVAEKKCSPTHLYLCAAAGIRHPRHGKRIIGLMLAKTGKFFLRIPGLCLLQPLGKKILYKLVRVHDYEKASPLMQQTMINVAREDLTPLLGQIGVPTDLFWGTEDGMTPYSDATTMASAIPHARLHSYAGVRHRVHRDRASDIAKVILALHP